MEIAVLALGCFWGPEKKFSQINGILKTEVGYCGGHNSNTTYKEVCSGNSGHAEVVKLEYDPSIISYNEIIETFFKIHDPTTLNSQGPDFGTQYRSEIFYHNEEQKKIAKEVLNHIDKKLNGKVVTKISEIKNYCKAEEYHQNYLEKN
jgi:peptide-methionine (S)-S-oxide reductase|tara:strand:- start:140 stop:583 length:444 start_codon:yes stop_codon:yes gene_type:complete